MYLLDDQNVFDNVLTGALIVKKNTPELVKKAKELLKKFGLNEKTGRNILISFQAARSSVWAS